VRCVPSFDFHPVSNDRRIRRELLDSFLRVSRHLPGIELAEGAAIAIPFLEHDRPTEPGLRRFEHQEFEVAAIVMDRHPHSRSWYSSISGLSR